MRRFVNKLIAGALIDAVIAGAFVWIIIPSGSGGDRPALFLISFVTLWIGLPIFVGLLSLLRAIIYHVIFRQSVIDRFTRELRAADAGSLSPYSIDAEGLLHDIRTNPDAPTEAVTQLSLLIGQIIAAHSYYKTEAMFLESAFNRALSIVQGEYASRGQRE